MENICSYNSCSGCFACQNICPKDCISLCPDVNGELHPVIDHSQCIDCGLCAKICPVNHDVEYKEPNNCFAAWNSDVKQRKLSASGGIAASMYSFFIEELKGVVYGVNYDSDLRPVYCRIDNSELLYTLKGSKYVQAFVGDNYRLVKKDLDNSLNVLFIGTPCQIAGLKSFLRKDYERLITCDLLCHGVPPYEYLKKELLRVAPKKIKLADSCRFRGNDGYNYYLSLWNRDQLLYSKKGTRSYYLFGFLTSIILRESCYSCKYSRKERVSDITIGDFLGLGKLKSVDLQPNNTSVVVVNSNKGRNVWQAVVAHNNHICCEERNYSEAVEGGGSFRKPTLRNKKRDQFLQDYQKRGWSYAIKRALWKSILKNNIKNI